MRLLIAIGGTVLLAFMLQGCQSGDFHVAYGYMAVTWPPDGGAPENQVEQQNQAEQPVDLRDHARAYAARLRRDGCIKSREGALFDAAAEVRERDLAAFKGAAASQATNGPVPGTAAELAATLAEARLQVADAASASGCLDIANVHYKAVIRSFSGPGFARYRQRAELGLSASQL